MSEESYEERQKRINRERQQCFRAKNKARLAEERARDREIVRNYKKQHQPTPPAPAPAPAPVVQPQNIIINRDNRRTIKIKVKKIIYNQEVVMKMIHDSTSFSDETKVRYTKEVKAVFRVTQCEDLLKCLSNFDKIKKELESAKQIRKPEEDYGVNTIKKFIEGVLVVIDKIKVPVSVDILNKYREILEIYKQKSIALREGQQEAKEAGSGAVVFIDTILKTVEDKFGMNSKPFLITSFYKDAPMRDNMGGLVLIPSIRNNDDSKTNYAIVPRQEKQNCILVFNEYKTDKKYGQLKFTLNKQTSDLLRKYIKKHGINYDNRLFPEYSTGKMSSYISNYMKRCGFTGEGGINYMRHSIATEDFNRHDLTPEMKVKLSRKMGHSVVASFHYIRKIVGV